MARDYSTRRWKKIRTQFRQQCAADNALCWLCGQPINYTLTDPHNDNTWEPDHYHPRSTHPAWAEDINNLRPSHRACNRTRSNNAANQMLGIGTTTREWFS